MTPSILAQGEGSAAKVDTEFMEFPGRVNASMPEFVVHKIDQLPSMRQRAVNEAKVGLVGIAYAELISPLAGPISLVSARPR